MSAPELSGDITGGEAIVRMLLAHEVGPVFGMGGFQLLPYYDAARRLGLNHHLINDERAGAFAADAYAKVSGRVGVVDATLGPGATNLVTGLVEALNAGSAMVALVGDANRDHAWKNMTQEAHQLEILRPACKELIRVEAVHRIPELLRRAFALATTGRPGPVVVSIPEDVCHGSHAFAAGDFVCDPRHQRVPALRWRPDDDSLAEAAELIAAARQPIVLAGGGIHLSQACEQLAALARSLNLPVAHTMSGKGAIACTDPLSAGLFGRYDRIANGFIEAADLIVVVGCKLGEIATKRYTVPPAGKRILHIELVPEEFDRTLTPALRLCGDARATLAALARRLAPQAAVIAGRQAGHAAAVAQAMARWREQVAARLDADEVPVPMARLLKAINASLPEDGLLIADGGFAAHWGGLLFDSRRPGRSFVPDRGFASIGYGVPGAIGAALAAPGRTVYALTGDGGFNMMLGELETARRLALDITVIVVNNAASGYVKALQHLMYGADAYQSSDLAETDYARVVQAFGCTGIRVERPDQLEAAFATAKASRGPVVIDVVVTRDPAKMLPGVDNRTAQVKQGDRIA